MKLGILTRNYPPMHGGMSRHAYGLATSLAHKIDVEVHTPSSSVAQEIPFAVRNTLDVNVTNNIDLIRNSNVDAWLGLSANFAPLVPHSPRPFALYFHGNDFLTPVFDPDKSLVSKLGRIPLLWRARKPLVRPLQNYLRPKHRTVLQRGAKQSSRIFFNSNFTRDLALQHYSFPNIPLEVLPPGCDDSFFQKHDEKDPSVLRLLTVANLSSSNRRKNIDGVLEALARLNGEFDLQYTVIGHGDDSARLIERAEQLGLASSVRFLGSVSDATLLEAYRSHDVLVLASEASKVDVEGFGMVYIEANASGMPVLASAQGGAVEAIVDGRTGLVISDSSPTTIADGIRRLRMTLDSYQEAELNHHAENFRQDRIATRLVSSLLSSP